MEIINFDHDKNSKKRQKKEKKKNKKLGKMEQLSKVVEETKTYAPVDPMVQTVVNEVPEERKLEESAGVQPSPEAQANVTNPYQDTVQNLVDHKPMEVASQTKPEGVETQASGMITEVVGEVEPQVEEPDKEEEKKAKKKKRRKKIIRLVLLFIILFIAINGILYHFKKPSLFNLIFPRHHEVWIISSHEDEVVEEQRMENSPSLVKITNPETLADIEETLNSLLLLNWYDDVVVKAGNKSYEITEDEGKAKSKLALAYKFIENNTEIKPNFKGTQVYYPRTVIDDTIKELTGKKPTKALVHDGALKYDSLTDTYFVNKDNPDGYFAVKVKDLKNVQYNNMLDYFVCEVTYCYPTDEDAKDDELDSLYDEYTALVVLRVDKQNKYLKYRYEDEGLNTSRISTKVTSSVPKMSVSRIYGTWTPSTAFTKDKEGNKEEVSLQEIYGTSVSYGCGDLILKEDGTFTEDLAPVSEYDTPSSGTFEVSKGTEVKLYYEEHFLHSEIVSYDKESDTIDMNVFRMDGKDYGVTLKRVK